MFTYIAEITRSDLSTLRKATWLNDEVFDFDFYFNEERSKMDKDLPKVHLFNAFLLP